MGLFDKANAAAQASAEDSFTLASGIRALKKQRQELEDALTKAETSYEKAIHKTRLDCVNERIAQSRGTGKVELTEEEKKEKRDRLRRVTEPWNFPGPVAPAGMKPVRFDGTNTYVHVLSNEPECADESASYDDYLSVVAWAGQLQSWSPEIVAAHWGALCEREGKGNTVFTKTNLMLLQERIKKITNDKTNKEKPAVGLFKTGSATKALTEAKQEAEKPKEEPKVAAPFEAERREAAKSRLLEAGFTIYKDIVTREQAEDVLKHRTMAILELGVIYEQFEKAKKDLEQQIGDISLVFDEALERFYKANNPTGKKTWSLQYGDLKAMNKAESIALDTDYDPDESRLQAWLKIQFEKNPELAQRLGIRQLVSYSRDTKEIANWIKEQKTPPVVPGMKRTPARENVFSIAPSLDVAKDKIKSALKEKGIR